LDNTALTGKLNTLKAERERKREIIERLQEKLKALNNELASRRQERDECMQELKIQQNKNKRLIARRKQDAQESGFGGDQLEQKDKVKKCVEEALQEKVRKFSRRTENGFRVFDEMDLMVEKPLEEQNQENYVDTVLVTYQVPNTELAYKLSYRIDKQTKAFMLREDACNYWGISEVEFVLKTYDNSKVHDDIFVHSVFSDGERAELILSQKTPKKVFTGLGSIPSWESDAVRAKTGKLAKAKTKTKKVAEGDAQTSKPENAEDFFESVQGVPGLWKYMTLRDMGYKSHLNRFRLRNFLVYSALWVLNLSTLLLYRPQLSPYINYEGFNTAMTTARFDPDSSTVVLALENITTADEAWNWITYTVSAELMANESQAKLGYYLNSFLELRMQQVRGIQENASQSCPADAPASAACYEVIYDDESMGTEDLESLREYWDGGNITDAVGVEGQDGRHTAVAPWQFVSAEDARSRFKLRSNQGRYQSYDPSGYRVQYFLQHENPEVLQQAYRDDMIVLKERGWNTRRVRSLTLTMVTYSGSYDTWSAVRFLFEFPTTGRVSTKVEQEQYEPASWEIITTATTEEWLRFEEFLFDTISYAIVLYIGIFQVFGEIRAAMKDEDKTFFMSLFQVVIFWDLLIFCCFNVLYWTRYIHFAVDTMEYSLELTEHFTSGADEAYWYLVNIMLHVTVICATSMRILRFATLSRHWFVLWKTLSDAAGALTVFLLVFIPAFLGLVGLAYATWGSELQEFHNYGVSLISVLNVAKGDLEISRLSLDGKPWARGVALFTRIVFEVIFINVWIGLLCHIYQKNRIRYGYNASEYQWGALQWARWLSWSSLFKYSGWKPIADQEEENADDEDEDA